MERRGENQSNPYFLDNQYRYFTKLKNKKIMDREEFQKKYDNSILVCCTENSIKKVFNICDLMDLTASKSKQITAILIGEQTAKNSLFHVEQFLSDFYKIEEGDKKERPTFNKGSRIMYTIEDENGNTHTVTRLSKRCYELKECKTLFVTDDEGVVTGIYKEK